MSSATAPSRALGSRLELPGPELVYQILGVVLPLAVLVPLLATQALSFDGAMNLQVAQNLATEGAYARDYIEYTLFPTEIQSSAWFILVPALAIKLFGSTNLAFQSGNLVFAALLLTAVSLALPRSRAAYAVVPGAALFATPWLLAYSTGGYGEGAVAALVLCAFVLLARAADAPEHQVRRTVLAGVCLGLALTIKTVAIAAFPVGVALLVLVLARSTHRLRVLGAAVAGAAVPVIAWEAYRAIVLGGAYIEWWRTARSDIAGQAMAPADADGPGRLDRIGTHLDILGDGTQVAPVWWVVLALAVPAMLVALTALARRTGSLERHRVTLAVAGALALYALLYLAWWLALTPTEKAWMRRVTIGLFALGLAAYLVTVLAVRMWRTLPEARAPRAAWIPALALLTVVALAVIAVPAVRSSIDAFGTRDDSLEDVTELGADAADLAEGGADLYGIGWWSAPVVSLYGDVDLTALGAVDVCAPDIRGAIDDGDAYVVWDRYATAIQAPEPEHGYLEFTQVEANAAGSIWQLELVDGACG